MPDGSYRHTVVAVYRSWSEASAASNQVTVQGDAARHPRSAWASRPRTVSTKPRPGTRAALRARASAERDGRERSQLGRGLHLSASRAEPVLERNGLHRCNLRRSCRDGDDRLAFGSLAPADGDYVLHVRATDGCGQHHRRRGLRRSALHDRRDWADRDRRRVFARTDERAAGGLRRHVQRAGHRPDCGGSHHHCAAGQHRRGKERLKDRLASTSPSR